MEIANRQHAGVRVLMLLGTLISVSGCNTTGPMTVPKISAGDIVVLDKPANQQASFALSKVVANIRRGTVIGHFPAGGVEGVDGTLCNYRHRGESTLEWSTGTSVLGNWSSELGEVFFQALAQSGINVAGNPSDLFGQQQKASSAEYLIGARIKKIASNICQEHDAWNGFPKNSYSGEMYVDVEWTIFSSLKREEVLKFQTEGYSKQKEPKSDGIVLLLHNAFAHATEGLLNNETLISIARREYEETPEQETASFEKLAIVTDPASKKKIEDNIADVLTSVATIRIGQGHGSGFFISQDGYLLTNAHVVGDAVHVAVILNNGLELDGEVIRRSKNRDIALVKVGLRIPHPLPIQTDHLKPLDRVYAIGTPFEEGLKSSVTTGIVSGFRTFDGQKLIQADAAISPGNSGGPLTDENGNVVGISVLKIALPESDNIAFFIPIQDGLKSLNLTTSTPGS